MFTERLSTWQEREASTTSGLQSGTKRVTATRPPIPVFEDAGVPAKRTKVDRPTAPAPREGESSSSSTTAAAQAQKKLVEKETWEARQKAREEEVRKRKENQRKLEEVSSAFPFPRARGRSFFFPDCLLLLFRALGAGKAQAQGASQGARCQDPPRAQLDQNPRRVKKTGLG